MIIFACRSPLSKKSILAHAGNDFNESALLTILVLWPPVLLNICNLNSKQIFQTLAREGV